MNEIKIFAKNIGKSFNGFDFVFRNLSFEINTSDVLGILGPNGSGKSTLLKIIARLIVPTEGKLSVQLNSTELSIEKQRLIQCFVAPYLILFEEFKPLEHIEIHSKILGKEYDPKKALDLIEFFNLKVSMDKPIKEFSSGMKQRMKYILAFLFEPEIILLDEPFSNLDESGISKVVEYINNFKNSGKTIIIATNDSREAKLCNKFINLKDLSSNEPNFYSSV